MPSTPIYGLRYQSLTDPPDGAALGQNLANDVEDELVRIDAAVVAALSNYVGDSARSTASGTFTTVETVIQSFTFTAVAGVRYKVSAVQSVQSTVAGDSVAVRLRWAAGATVTSAGTLITAVVAPCYTANLGFLASFAGTFIPGAGQTTVGVTMVRNIGSGTLSSFGAAAMVNTILVERLS